MPGQRVAFVPFAAVPDHVVGLSYLAAAIVYPVSVVLAERRYGIWRASP